ncbi:MAG: hypothetical protein ACHREM_06575 [Polyangiales bacterium]
MSERIAVSLSHIVGQFARMAILHSHSPCPRRLADVVANLRQRIMDSPLFLTVSSRPFTDTRIAHMSRGELGQFIDHFVFDDPYVKEWGTNTCIEQISYGSLSIKVTEEAWKEALAERVALVVASEAQPSGETVAEAILRRQGESAIDHDLIRRQGVAVAAPDFAMNPIEEFAQDQCFAGTDLQGARLSECFLLGWKSQREFRRLRRDWVDPAVQDRLPPSGPVAATTAWYRQRHNVSENRADMDAFGRGWNGAALWINYHFTSILHDSDTRFRPTAAGVIIFDPEYMGRIPTDRFLAQAKFASDGDDSPYGKWSLAVMPIEPSDGNVMRVHVAFVAPEAPSEELAAGKTIQLFRGPYHLAVLKLNETDAIVARRA